MSTAGGQVAPSKRATRSKSLNKGQARTKIVVRRLPANLPEPVFMESIKPLVPETSLERATTFVPGKVSKNPVKGNTFARAYIYFKNEKLALEFQKAYHGHVFMDRNGNEGRAHVEFAPFQKIPRNQRKPDAKQGTIEEDPDYIAFLQSLNAEPTEADKEMKLSGTELLLKESAINPKSTPLLEALRAQKAAAQAKAAAAKLAARQGRQAGKAGLSNSSKQQITILSNRNAKDRAQSSSNASGASNKNQQNQQSVQQQGKKVSQTAAAAAASAEADANGQGAKVKRERRRKDRASKRAGVEGAATSGGGAAGDAPVPQITLLKPKPANNPPASGGASQSAANTPDVSKQTPQGSQGPPNSGGRRGQQNQGGQQQQQQQQQQQSQGTGTPNSGATAKKDGTQRVNADGASGRPSRSRRNRGGERGKQEPKAVPAGGNAAGNSGGNAGQANSAPASGNKGQDGQGGGGGSSRPSRSRRARGGTGGQENVSSGPAIQG